MRFATAKIAMMLPCSPRKNPPTRRSAFQAGATLFQTDITSFLASPDLASEVFGPETLLINYSKKEQILEAARGLHGHLTATVHGTEQDIVEFSELIAILENKVGRIIYNGYPTGLELCDAIVHGGPYPCQHRFTHHFRRYAGDLSLRSPRLLSGFSGRRATRRIEKREFSWHLAHGGRRIDTLTVLIDDSRTSRAGHLSSGNPGSTLYSAQV